MQVNGKEIDKSLEDVSSRELRRTGKHQKTWKFTDTHTAVTLTHDSSQTCIALKCIGQPNSGNITILLHNNIVIFWSAT